MEKPRTMRLHTSITIVRNGFSLSEPLERPTLAGMRATNIVVVLLSATMLQASVRISQANQLTNGSFETPVIESASFLDFGVGGEPAGFSWSVTTNTVDIVSNGFDGGTADDGTQWLDLVGFGNTGGIKQTFATTPSQQYTLSF